MDYPPAFGQAAEYDREQADSCLVGWGSKCRIQRPRARAASGLEGLDFQVGELQGAHGLAFALIAATVAGECLVPAVVTVPPA